MQAQALAVFGHLQNGIPEVAGNTGRFTYVTSAGAIPANQKAVLGRAVHQQNPARPVKLHDPGIKQIKNPVSLLRLQGQLRGPAAGRLKLAECCLMKNVTVSVVTIRFFLLSRSTA